MPSAAAASACLAVLDGGRDLRGALRAVRASSRRSIRRRVDFFTKSRAFDITRARAEIGFAPRVGLRDGIGRTLAWYREGRLALSANRIPRAQEDLFGASKSARAKYARLIVGRPGLGRAAEVRTGRSCCRSGCRARSGSRCASASIRRCSAPAGATSSSARTSCCGIRTRSTSATTSSSTTTACSTRRARPTPASDRQRRVHRPQHDPLVQERRHRPRRRRQHRLQLRAVFGERGSRWARTR